MIFSFQTLSDRFFFSKNQVVFSFETLSDRFFFKKPGGFFHEKKTVFFSMVFFQWDFFCTVFFKVDLLEKHPTRYDFIFFFSLINLTSIQALGRQKFWRRWNERGRTLFWNCLAWRLNQFDSLHSAWLSLELYNGHQCHHATSKERRSYAMQKMSFEKKVKTLDLIREFVCFSIKREKERASSTILDHIENSSNWVLCSNATFAQKLQYFETKWKKTLVNF